MPFKFQWLCELLEELDSNRYKHARSAARTFNHEHQIIHRWYERFSHRIERTGPGAIAFLSCLFPERRPDRIYGLQHKRLSQVFGRALGLGASRVTELNQWTTRDGVELPECIERVMQQCENQTPPQGKEVTLEEINDVLDLVAARCPSSSAATRARFNKDNIVDLLTPVARRLHSKEAKWFARMMLKRYHPVQIPEYEALHGFHFMLPNLLSIQTSFEAAVSVLAKEAIRYLPARPERNYESALHALVAEHMQPRTGVMVRRQPYHKARSIRNCCKLAAMKQMSVERKYDGEYCQVHIDMSGNDLIQIFSKSGRDSTSDRMRLHMVIEEALRIGRNGCRIRRNCIIEGELLVWGSTSKSTLPFHKIRKHVRHGGYDIGTMNDSPVQRDEHLMIAFYDILLLDDQPLLNKPHQTRRQYLKAVLHTTEGRAILGERTIIDFRSSQAHKKLREVFAKAVTQRWEGLILKGSQDPYFTWGRQCHGIKLKKDYISGLGDSADLCVVGGRRDAHVEAEIGLGPLLWTSFFVGAVCNLEDVRRFAVKPKIKVIDTLTHYSMPTAEMLDLNRLGQLIRVPFVPSIDEFDIEVGHSKMKLPTDLFTIPFVVEIMGAGYEKLSDSPYYTLRFPRKVDGKVRFHTDRTLLDTVSFTELQAMAERSLTAANNADSQEDALWIERLIVADGRRQQDQSSSQATSSARTPTSAPVVSLSPVSPKDGSSQPVFIRPDTEEPETQRPLQSTQTSVGEHVNRCEPRENVPNSPVEKNIKRPTQVLREGIVKIPSSDSDDKTQKRKCLKNDLADVRGAKRSSRPVETVSINASQGKHIPISYKAIASKPSSTAFPLNDFEPTASFRTPTKLMCCMKTKGNHGQESLPTPESDREGFSELSNTDYFSIPTFISNTTGKQEIMIRNENAQTTMNAVEDTLRTVETFPPVLLAFPPHTPVSMSLISKIEASYTFSIKVFLQHIKHYLTIGKVTTYHIILIQREDIESVVDMISQLATEVERYVLSADERMSQDVTVIDRVERNVVDCHQQRQRILDDISDRILVFDYHVLDQVSIGSHQTKKLSNKLMFGIESLAALDFDKGKGKDAVLFMGSVRFVWRGAQNLPAGKNVEVNLDYGFDWVNR